jgi:hypothetical protein
MAEGLLVVTVEERQEVKRKPLINSKVAVSLTGIRIIAELKAENYIRKVKYSS